SDPVVATMGEDSHPTPFNLTLNATTVDSSPLTWSIPSQAGHGTAVISASFVTSATLAYTPTADYNGSDSFIVQVADSDSLTDTVTVSVTVEAVNDAPLAVDDTMMV